MFNVIICDDNKDIVKKVSNIVTKYMKGKKLQYNIHMYNDYDSKFMSIISSNIPFKIYILDIETPSRSGIDIAREIRRKDVDSVIIFLTGHDELGNTLLKNDLMFLSFINKFDDSENRLNKCLNQAIKLLHRKQVLRLSDSSNTYILNIDDILYFAKESFARKVTIKTDYAEYLISKNLNEIESLLDDRFIKTHRSCVVNKDRISRIDKQNRYIYFDNNDYTDLLSDKYKKELDL